MYIQTSSTYVRLIKLVKFLKRNRGHFIHLMPVFGIILVMLSLTSYTFLLHHEVTVKRWCICQHDISVDCEKNFDECFTSTTIKGIAWYLAFMIMYNYMQTTVS